jgi:hypothetical protein
VVDEQLVEARAAEGAGGDLAGRNFDDLVGVAIAGVPAHCAAPVDRNPYAAPWASTVSPSGRPTSDGISANRRRRVNPAAAS